MERVFGIGPSTKVVPLKKNAKVQTLKQIKKEDKLRKKQGPMYEVNVI